MALLQEIDYFDWLIETYFSDPEQVLHLKKGDSLLKRSEFNDRLYLVKKGKLLGFGQLADGNPYVQFAAQENMFVGVVSFFSQSFKAAVDVEAVEDTEVAYIKRDQQVVPREGTCSLFDQFMPVVVRELVIRQLREQEIYVQKEQVMHRLHNNEKLASLGQMAAGLAHELNNAIAVLERNTAWLQKNITQILENRYPQEFPFFKHGISKGRNLSSSEVRERTRELMTKFAIAKPDAQKLAQTGIDNDTLKRYVEHMDVEADIIHYYWDIGATFHDMLIAARHSAHVVKSVKTLGAQKSSRDLNTDVNESIRESLSLLNSKFQNIKVIEEYRELPPLVANLGELVQVWTNLIKNAVEAMTHANSISPKLIVRTEYKKKYIHVEIEDNGPGIPENLQTIIFQPNVTTKAEGLSFGLGLGLTIIERIVDSYGGTISLNSIPGKTVFTVKLPAGDVNGKA